MMTPIALGVLAGSLQAQGGASDAASGVPPLLVWMIPLLPILGFLFQVFIGSQKLPKPLVSLVSCGVVLLSAALAWHLFFHLLGIANPAQRHFTANLGPWIHVPGTDGQESGPLAVIVNHKLLVDPLTAVMILVVTNIGFLIHVYSTGYMAEEKRYARYFAYLNLFTGFMLILVMASSLILMFVGWEGVGLCSYLLIGFWYEKKENAIAGMKAFIVNRVGDFAFTIGVLTLFVYVGNRFGVWTVDFLEIKKVLGEHSGDVGAMASFVGIMMFIGATGKSAQIPLYTWLPDAMAGPTPVSALIHAATMVTAGVYMIARMNFLFSLSPAAMTVVAVIGALTALFAGTIGVAQNDIKKVLAYSTVSQLGFMFLGVGVGAYAAGVFHLFTHAFFKACLFLGSGAVIHGMGGEQDIRKMGALRGKMPVTYWTFVIATLAIAGFPLTSGFFSKDEILWQAFRSQRLLVPGWTLFGVGLVAALFTAFYMTRLVLKTFHGRAQWAAPTSFSGGGVDLPDWMDEEEQKKKSRGHEPEEPSHAGALPQDESLLDLGRIGKGGAAGHGAPGAHDAGGHDPGHAHDAGGGHGHGHGHAGEPHESPPSMLFALVLLAAGSILVGFLNMPKFMPKGDLFGEWLEPVVGSVHDSGAAPEHSGVPAEETGHAAAAPKKEPHEPSHESGHGLEIAIILLSAVVGLGGIAAGIYVYGTRSGVPARDFADSHKELYDLVLNKYRVDELYDRTVVQPLLEVNEIAGRFDNEIVDGAVNGSARVGSSLSRGTGLFDNEVVDAALNAGAQATQGLGRKVRRLQTGNIREYLTFALVGGLFVIALFCIYLTWDRIEPGIRAFFRG
jgi:NADH-quinone oxidoreductase subunit L